MDDKQVKAMIKDLLTNGSTTTEAIRSVAEALGSKSNYIRNLYYS